MDWISAMLMIFSIASQSGLLGGGSSSDEPVLPGYIAPDFEPVWAQEEFANYQDVTRNTLLNEFYGGSVDENGRAIFGGELPAEEYKAAQTRVYDTSENLFSPDLSNYYAERGIADTGAITSGAQAELSTDYDQKAREIEAKSHDIYAMTLGSLFGEVNDAGAQAAQYTGLVSQANQMENARLDESYANAMSKYAYDQSQPSTWETVGSMLPLLMQMYSGYSSSPTSYSAGSSGTSGSSIYGKPLYTT